MLSNSIHVRLQKWQHIKNGKQRNSCQELWRGAGGREVGVAMKDQNGGFSACVSTIIWKLKSD